jgi:hypothetical protein
MPEHKLSSGRAVIDALTGLGESLDYTVVTEKAVNRHSKPAAVDVAWFAEGEQRYPLMIFEVESSASNSMASNPAKVFGQPATQFERPLFFFHVIVRSGSETSRVENLRGTFGSHNYRVYPLSSPGTATALVLDVLSQHRRIRKQFRVGATLEVLLAADKLDADIRPILTHAAELGLRGHYLHDLACLAAHEVRARDLFISQVTNRMTSDTWPGTDLGYETWLGDTWGDPIHLGIVSNQEPLMREVMVDELIHWQEHASFMSMIGPHFGLSADYDNFILGYSAALWALIAALFIENVRALRYIVKQVMIVLDTLGDSAPKIWLHNAIWGLHIAAASRDRDHFELIRGFVNEHQGVPCSLLYSPPSFIDVDDSDWNRLVNDSKRAVPCLEDFLAELLAVRSNGKSPSGVDMALAALVSDDLLALNGTDLVNVLASGGQH